MFFELDMINNLPRPIAFTNGCFDLFHYGHLFSLKESSKFGQSLVVAVNSDLSAAELKGSDRPIIQDSYRLEIIKSIRYVDYAFLFDEITVDRYVKEINPDFYVKGSEWKDNLPENLENTIVKFIDRVDNISTTDIIEKIDNEKSIDKFK
tara:strand:- start:744 stop:1193 length:450 start_codon:yes stop_codon:yes gene_type:complete